MTRTLSSAWTIYWRYVLPGFFFSAMGFFSILQWSGQLTGAPVFSWLFPATGLVITSILFLSGRKLCDVVLREDNTLEVESPGRPAEVIPLSAIARIRQSYVANPPTITLTMTAPTSGRKRVTFQPVGKGGILSEHSITKELRERIERARLSRVGPA